MTDETTTRNEKPDRELRALTALVDAKQLAISALLEARDARKARNADVTGLEESIDYEQLVLAGYVRALDNRKREVRDAQRG